MVREITYETVKSIESAAIDARRLEAEVIIHRNVLWALGAAISPLPLLDMVLCTGVQMRMLKQLSDLYGVPFRQRLVRKLLSALLVGVGGVGLGVTIGASLAKVIPGASIVAFTTPALVGAFTHAVGKSFSMHFETGGTFLDFDPTSVRAYFRHEYEAAREALAKNQRPAGVPIVPIVPIVPASAKT